MSHCIGHPDPVARDVYDTSIEFLKEAVNKSRIGESDKQKAFKQLAAFCARGRTTGERNSPSES